MGVVGRTPVLLVALVALAVAGCAGPSPAPNQPSVPSGLTRHSDGSAEATGYVAFANLEGGFWALYDRPPGPSSSIQPKIVVVLLPGAVSESAIAALKGAHVRVTGRLQEGVSTRMAGPELQVATIAGVTSDAPR
jgi:hypothetical protein